MISLRPMFWTPNGAGGSGRTKTFFRPISKTPSQPRNVTRPAFVYSPAALLPMPSLKNIRDPKMSDALARLYAIFGNAVFLVVPKGTKRPKESAWQKISFADTQESDYQVELERCVRAGGNIGVLLGPASDGLYSIDLDGDALVPD